MRVDSSVPDDRVRRDVDRYPSGDNTVFQTTCRTCHAMMDGIGGGYAYFDFVNNAITQSLAPVGKYNQNVTVYPAGFVTTDNGWLNRFTTTQNEAILSRPDGTPPPSSGKGIRAVGTMFANSKGFSSCMTKKVFETVCGRVSRTQDANDLSRLEANFIGRGYKLRGLFEEAATLPTCVGQ